MLRDLSNCEIARSPANRFPEPFSFLPNFALFPAFAMRIRIPKDYDHEWTPNGAQTSNCPLGIYSASASVREFRGSSPIL
jgi:hypothetical protein